MAKRTNPPRINLPRGWPRRVRSAMLHVITLAEYAMAYTRSWAVNGRIARLRLKAENDQLRQEVALLTEEIRSSVAASKPALQQTRNAAGSSRRVPDTHTFLPSWTLI